MPESERSDGGSSTTSSEGEASPSFDLGCDALLSVTYYNTERKSKQGREVPRSQQGPEFAPAKNRELQKLLDWNVYTRHQGTPPPGAQIIRTRFVCTHKDILDDNGGHVVRKAKARLVALGYQQDVTDEATDAPTATREGLRLLAAIAAEHGWDICSLDVESAFLQADPRDNTKHDIIALVPPPEANEPPDVCWILNKSLYGLRDAGAHWHTTFVNALVDKFGFRQCVNDESMLTLHQEGALAGCHNSEGSDARRPQS